MKRNKKNLNMTLLITLMVLMSITILFINEKWIKDDFLHNLFMTLAISGITTGVFSVFSSMIEKENTKEILEKNFPIIQRCNLYGLIGINKSFPFDDDMFRNDFIYSNKVYFLMNDGKNFFSSNTEMFKERFKQAEKETNIILLDFEQEDTMSVLTRKNEHVQDYYKNKIKGVIDYHFRKVEKIHSHNINIRLNSNYNTLAMIVTDNFAMISLFRVSSGKDEVPHMIFDKSGTEYERIRNDIINVWKASKEFNFEKDTDKEKQNTK